MQFYVLSNGDDQKRVALEGSWLAEKIICPWCQDPQACCVSTRQGLFYCFACGVSGTCMRVTDEELLAEYQDLGRDAFAKGDR